VILSAREGKWSPEPVSHTLWVYVDDLEPHFAHAVANGAAIVSEISQHGYRGYEADDLEGHRWNFVQSPPYMRQPGHS
jgi:uncharacterized glyoxalase superfamily protein PhnB